MIEASVHVDKIRIVQHRASNGSCLDLGKSLQDAGQLRPIALWRDGTLISGERRVFAAMLVKIPRLQAVYIGSIEEAAKHLLADNQDPTEAFPQKWSDVCRLWQTLRRLDEPAAVKRADENRRRGVELRRLTEAGARTPGRANSRTDDYVLSVICEPFGVSQATASRAEKIYRVACGLIEATDERRELAMRLLADIDNGGPVWRAYQQLRGEDAPRPERLRPVSAPVASVGAAKQRAAWNKALPQLEGLISGLIELGPPNPKLTWEQVGPVHARLSAARRELEKMIKQMKETSK
jgi:hypothetical protein